MKYQSIAEICASNDRIREKLIKTLENLTKVQASSLPEGEKWTIAQVAEHLSMVENGMSRICSKLLSTAKDEGKLSDGSINISTQFSEKSVEVKQVKLEAPEVVQPTNTKSVAESLDALKQNRASLNALRPLFEEFDGNNLKFPHPFFGDLSAVEWLVLVGGHEARHLQQIRNIIEKVE